MQQRPYTPADIRFTQSKDGKTLYAIVLEIPNDGQFLVKSLTSAAGEIKSVSLLGYGKADWEQNGAGLVVNLPRKLPGNVALALKIMGKDLQPELK